MLDQAKFGQVAIEFNLTGVDYITNGYTGNGFQGMCLT